MPEGNNLHTKGVKDDNGKPRLDLVLGDFSQALWAIGEVGTFGANKYTDRGWHEVDNGIERYSNALLRHYLNFKRGEIDDPESNLPHLAHLAWNALAILQLYIEEKNIIRKELQPGSIYEMAVDHKDFSPIQKLQSSLDEFNSRCIPVTYKYKYDCHYKEECNE